MKHYRVEYSAVTADELPVDASDRLASALDGLPGTAGFDRASAVIEDRQLTASFNIEVRLGMADAARDGSRLAKEALKGAGLGAAQLVELRVELADVPRPSDDPASSWDDEDRSTGSGAESAP